MPETKECPLCGEKMRLHRRESVVHVPGSPTTSTKSISEWVCPECDYFEEADEEGT
ncbi:MAG: YgiT-type zinc finger protein [Betaproteobacteria bacterium]